MFYQQRNRITAHSTCCRPRYRLARPKAILYYSGVICHRCFFSRNLAYQLTEISDMSIEIKTIVTFIIFIACLCIYHSFYSLFRDMHCYRIRIYYLVLEIIAVCRRISFVVEFISLVVFFVRLMQYCSAGFQLDYLKCFPFPFEEYQQTNLSLNLTTPASTRNPCCLKETARCRSAVLFGLKFADTATATTFTTSLRVAKLRKPGFRAPNIPAQNRI